MDKNMYTTEVSLTASFKGEILPVNNEAKENK